MTVVRLDLAVHVLAPVHAVFEHCLDPRRIYADDPSHTVTEAEVAEGGVGTRAHLVARLGPLTEHIALEYVEVVPDRRIVIDAHPAPRPLTPADDGPGVATGGRLCRLTWTWTFTPDADGTFVTVLVVEHDAPPWEHTLDVVTAHGGTHAFSAQVLRRLHRIKLAVEHETGAPAGA
ncbi:MAG: SRPBCC family protein [Actinotalea sp.]|nr:SRPBCC family protein [Actinotalea sp.]